MINDVAGLYDTCAHGLAVRFPLLPSFSESLFRQLTTTHFVHRPNFPLSGDEKKIIIRERCVPDIHGLLRAAYGFIAVEIQTYRFIFVGRNDTILYGDNACEYRAGTRMTALLLQFLLRHGENDD
jgi:hypothetical protein